MQSDQFRVGDRVRLAVPMFFAPAGALGTILRVPSTWADIYVVLFDALDRAWIIADANLALIDDVRAVGDVPR